MLSLICAYLDDVSYTHLWITCKRYCVLLRCEVFLRVLFRDRHTESLSLTDLRRGFSNIIKFPTTTYFRDQIHINRYLYGKEHVLFDIFDRMWVIEPHGLRNTNLRLPSSDLSKSTHLNTSP